MSYEAYMLATALQLHPTDQLSQNLVTEERVLHMRNLCNFCKPQRDTDLTPAHLFADYGKTPDYKPLGDAITEATSTYLYETREVELPSGKNARISSKIAFDTMLAHPSEERGEGFNYEPFVLPLWLKLKAVTDAIKSLAQNRGRDYGCGSACIRGRWWRRATI
jgi:hypothetical protein